jgi:hypothetical protein
MWQNIKYICISFSNCDFYNCHINERPFLIREADWSAGLDSYELNAVREIHHLLVMLL